MRWSILLLAALLTGSHAGGSARYGPRETAELVEIAAAEKEPEGRRARAIRQLEHTDQRTHLSLLRKLLREERSLDIRLASACTLAALGDRKAPKDLLLVSAYDRSRTPSCTRSDVLIALGRIRDPDAEMHLERALSAEPPADEPHYYQDCCRALAMLGTPGARRHLFAALRSERPLLRTAAVTPVSAIANDRSSADAPPARQALVLVARGDPVEEVAEQAASALLWSAVDGPAFYHMLEGDPDPRIRARAARVMNRQYLTPPRLLRLQAALARERDEGVRGAMEATLRSQKVR